MKKLLFTFSVTLTFFGFGQTNCDSLTINCCDVALIGNDTISLTAQNESLMEIFDYPGFRLIDGTSTIVAEETVNYFGIGFSEQTHYMNVLQAITLPFTGTLELWGGFYDTLYCEWNVTINEAGILELGHEMAVYPNPANDMIFIEGTSEQEFSIVSMDGKIISTRELVQNSIDISDLQRGCYFLRSESESLSPVMFFKQ